jgi:hypothetical protein
MIKKEEANSEKSSLITEFNEDEFEESEFETESEKDKSYKVIRVNSKEVWK